MQTFQIKNVSFLSPVGLLFCLSLLSWSCKSQQADLLHQPVANTIVIDSDDSHDSIVLKAAHVVPRSNQYEALKDEFIAFIHFGPNTFTSMEWGNGMEDPKVFDLKELHTDQWCKAMKDAGMTKVILTVKHHDGFCLWQSRYTEHGIMSTPYKDGKGDILRELSESCEKYGLKLGVYLSPADLFQIENPKGLYGNLSTYTTRTIPREVPGRPFKNKTTFTFELDDYNEYFMNQLFELLTEYGPIHEVWFDGAHPKRKGGQTYRYSAWKQLIRTLVPEAVIFGREDIRWCGNESGGTRDTEWNVIPYQQNPDSMNRFPDITAEDIGSREKLYEAKYLHYQQAETNTSIREGWFYRDDTDQGVRSVDDVFDIYERSVGGNSTFLLNIPPNKKGKFSSRDVAVLEETGRRIEGTYGTDLLENAKGPSNILDDDDASFIPITGENSSFVVSTPTPITLNRFVIQEDIRRYGERIEEHALDAWVDGAWKEIARATNVGYKRILRFPEVTTDKIRVRILKSRYTPAINTVAAHYYKTRPPQLTFSRSLEGMVSITPRQHQFGWKPHGENSIKNINTGMKIVYTTDGSEPTKNSMTFDKPFKMENGIVKAMAISRDQTGPVAKSDFGLIKQGWKILNADGSADNHGPGMAVDANPGTYWISKDGGTKHYLSVDLQKEIKLTGFIYTPPSSNKEGMIEQGTIQVSEDGKSWKDVDKFTFGNLINDPTPRKHTFANPLATRYIRIESNRIAGGKKSAAIAELDFLTQ